MTQQPESKISAALESRRLTIHDKRLSRFARIMNQVDPVHEHKKRNLVIISSLVGGAVAGLVYKKTARGDETPDEVVIDGKTTKLYVRPAHHMKNSVSAVGPDGSAVSVPIGQAGAERILSDIRTNDVELMTTTPGGNVNHVLRETGDTDSYRYRVTQLLGVAKQAVSDFFAEQPPTDQKRAEKE